MIALTARGFVVVGAKGLAARPYPTLADALIAMSAGASASCSDGACGAGGSIVVENTEFGVHPKLRKRETQAGAEFG